ncbi:hypothetical protein NCAS_0A02400 [Naumovozyma castellii]|uniref:Uncharacterized protein n=1 Tax=Naumovozyma castellii TaxID=27288 RepID=G0V5R0_NAUCA|nr:hypothetical protein NCAS_0A02400 [Naumovozyma castellii CBS 4309]CCC66798.1 hypothetical protein NCAS_0A02400 [Naumovozyma castellii CBS 4309]
MSTVTTTATTNSILDNPKQPKLKGWVQTASKSAPKQNSRKQNKAKAHPSLPKAENDVVESVQGEKNIENTTVPRQTAKKYKQPKRPPFNRDEVREFMNSLFKQYAESKDTQSTKELFALSGGTKNASSDWGTVTTSKYKNKNKKYACLNNVARYLKN